MAEQMGIYIVSLLGMWTASGDTLYEQVACMKTSATFALAKTRSLWPQDVFVFLVLYPGRGAQQKTTQMQIYTVTYTYIYVHHMFYGCVYENIIFTHIYIYIRLLDDIYKYTYIYICYVCNKYIYIIYIYNKYTSIFTYMHEYLYI